MKSSILFPGNPIEPDRNLYINEKIPSLVTIDNGVISFKDNKFFSTCYSPLRMIELGIFGHGYFGIADVDENEFKKILNDDVRVNNTFKAEGEFRIELQKELKKRIQEKSKGPQ